MSAHAGAVEAVDRILNRGGAADDVLVEVTAVLHARVFRWVAVLRRGTIVAEGGERPPEPALREIVVWQGAPVGELQAAPHGEPTPADRALLERVALLVSAQVGGAAA